MGSDTTLYLCNNNTSNIFYSVSGAKILRIAGNTSTYNGFITTSNHVLNGAQNCSVNAVTLKGIFCKDLAIILWCPKCSVIHELQSSIFF